MLPTLNSAPRPTPPPTMNGSPRLAENAAPHYSRLTPSNPGRASLATTIRISCARSRTNRRLSSSVTPATTLAGHHRHPRHLPPALDARPMTPRIPSLSTSMTTSRLTAISPTVRPLRFHPRGPLSTVSTAQSGTFCTKLGTRRCTPSTAMVSTSATYFCYLSLLLSAIASPSSASTCLPLANAPLTSSSALS